MRRSATLDTGTSRTAGKWETSDRHARALARAESYAGRCREMPLEGVLEVQISGSSVHGLCMCCAGLCRCDIAGAYHPPFDELTADDDSWTNARKTAVVEDEVLATNDRLGTSSVPYQSPYRLLYSAALHGRRLMSRQAT